MVDSFGSLPPKTSDKLSSSKTSRTRGGSARKQTEKNANTAKKEAKGIGDRKKTGKPGKNRPVRKELVERVRGEIAAGTFETPDRIEATIDCILDEILEAKKNRGL